MDDVQKGKPGDVVYAGRRPGAGGKAVDVFYHLLPGDVLGDKATFKALKRHLVVGGVYTGARFDDDGSAYGLATIRFDRAYGPDPVAVAGWRALDNELDADVAAARAEKKHKDGLLEQLLPLRRTMHALRRRGQHHEAQALLMMILSEAHRPLSAAERDAVEED